MFEDDLVKNDGVSNSEGDDLSIDESEIWMNLILPKRDMVEIMTLRIEW